MSNPFASFLNAVVTGDNFIGRRDLLAQLEERASGNGSVNVVGLPRMGKTSLVTNCFLVQDRFRWWVETHHRIPIYLSLDTQPTPLGLWGLVAKRLLDALRRMKRAGLVREDCFDGWSEQLRKVSLIPLADDRYTEVSDVFQCMKDDAGLSPVLILDEFDAVLRYMYPQSALSQLRALSQESPVVTCSRRLPGAMEQRMYGTGYFSNVNTTLFVGLFSEGDVDLYWSRFADAFDFLDESKFRQYKELVSRYVGRHPMLMSFMNHTALKDEADLLLKWASSSAQDKREIERAIRVAIHKEFKEQLRYLNEQELEDTAVELVVGGLGSPDKDAVSLLIDYQFVHKVPSAEKREMFGFDLGYHENQFRFVCFSDFASHQMRDLCDPPVVGYALLKKTELRLRELIRHYLVDLEGDHAFDLVYVNGYYHEKWEQAFLARVKTNINRLPPERRQEKKNRLQNEFDDVLTVWDKRYSNDYKQAYESEIDIVSSCTLGQLWNVFLNWQWKEYYADVLAETPLQRTRPDVWYEEVFSPILSWRNAVYHFRDEEWTEESVARSTEKCNAVCRAIEAWTGRKI